VQVSQDALDKHLEQPVKHAVQDPEDKKYPPVQDVQRP
jgi:hypothetical protein